MFRSRCLIVAFLFALALPARAQQPRNVLVMISDDQGLTAGCYGDPNAQTPNLDALAADGVRFSHAFAAVASCSPSRSVVLSGFLNHANGMYGLQHAEHHFQSHDRIVGLPKLLADAGYRTGLLGKLHVAPAASYPFEWTAPVNPRSVADVADKARTFLAAENGSANSKPFFLYIGFTDPHRAAKGFANEPTYRGVSKNPVNPDRIKVPGHLPNSPDVRADLAEYYESLNRLDQGVGLVMASLRESGKLDSTLVIFLSDNGIPFPGAKTSVYDAGIRLPLIVRAPQQQKRGLVNPAMVSWTDLTPTILDWAKAPGPRYALPGRSFLPILEQPNPVGWERVFASHTFHEVTMYYPMRAVRTRKHKLIWNLAHPLEAPFASDLWASPTWQGIRQRGDRMMGLRTTAAFLHRPEWELYDVEADPNEVKNLAADPAHAAVVAELKAQLKQMMRDTGDPWAIRFREEANSVP